jgi:hypothetical protein
MAALDLLRDARQVLAHEKQLVPAQCRPPGRAREIRARRRRQHLETAKDNACRWPGCRVHESDQLAPVIGFDKASKIAHHAMEHHLTVSEAALELGFVDEQAFDRVVDPAKMVKPYVAAASA